MILEGNPPVAAVFLDRDGVINEETGIVSDPDQLALIPGSAQAIRRINQEGVPAIIITNQPVVARGLISESELEVIHDHLRQLLVKEGARIDALYYCPHHENADDPEYRRICECRKPRPGLILEAARDFSLELDRCILIGDRTVDLLAAREAGCAAILVETGFAGRDGKCPEVVADLQFEDLKSAAEYFLPDSE